MRTGAVPDEPWEWRGNMRGHPIRSLKVVKARYKENFDGDAFHFLPRLGMSSPNLTVKIFLTLLVHFILLFG